MHGYEQEDFSIKNITGKITDPVKNAVPSIVNPVKDIGKDIGKGAVSVGKDIGKGATAFGKGVLNVGKAIGGVLKKVFGGLFAILKFLLKNFKMVLVSSVLVSLLVCLMPVFNVLGLLRTAYRSVTGGAR